MRYLLEQLPNGLFRLYDRLSGLSSLFDAGGSWVSGDLWQGKSVNLGSVNYD